jgi:hypothetical protein
VNDDRLKPDEDAELRRLHMLRTFGMVAGSVSSRYEALRGRDRRKDVRDPDEGTLAVPVEKNLWSDPPAPKATSGAQRPVGDTREVLADRPEARRGLGLFRR